MFLYWGYSQLGKFGTTKEANNLKKSWKLIGKVILINKRAKATYKAGNM